MWLVAMVGLTRTGHSTLEHCAGWAGITLQARDCMKTTMLSAPSIQSSPRRILTRYKGSHFLLTQCASSACHVYAFHDWQINQLRNALNLVICEEGISEWSMGGLQKLQKKARDLMLRVFLNKRKSTTPIHYKSSYKWNQVILIVSRVLLLDFTTGPRRLDFVFTPWYKRDFSWCRTVNLPDTQWNSFERAGTWPAGDGIGKN